MFSRAHLLRTLFIFRLEKALVCRMMYNRKFQPQDSSFIGSYIRVFSVLSTRCHTKGPTNLQVLIYGFLVYSLPGVTQKVLPIYRFLYTVFSVLSTRCHTKGPTNLQVLIYGIFLLGIHQEDLGCSSTTTANHYLESTEVCRASWYKHICWYGQPTQKMPECCRTLLSQLIV